MTIALAVVLSAAAAAASGPAPDPHRFWKPDRRPEQRAYEQALVAGIDPARLRSFHDLVSSATHVAGTPGDARVVRVKDGKVLASTSQHAAQVHIDLDTARLNALNEAAKMAASALTKKLNAE